MSRYARRVDENQSAIVKALEAVGCSVRDMSRTGEGFPDLAVGFRGRNHFIEVKNPKRSPCQRGLRKTQKKFSEGWRGQYAVVETVEQALAVVTA